MAGRSSLRRLHLYRGHSPALLTFAVVANLMVAGWLYPQNPVVALAFGGVTLLVCGKRAVAFLRSRGGRAEANQAAYHRGALVSFSIYGVVLALVTIATAGDAIETTLVLGSLIVAVASITAIALSSVTPRSGALILPAFVALAGVAVYRDPVFGAVMTGLLICIAVTLWRVGQKAAAQQEEAEAAQAEAQDFARRSREDLDEYLAASEEWAFELDADLTFTFVSQNYSDWTQVPGSHERLIGRSLAHVLDVFTDGGREADESTAALQVAFGARRTVTGHIMKVHSPHRGGRIYKAVSARPIFVGAERVFRGYRGWAVDVTEREEAQIALRAAHASLEDKVRERTAELEDARLAAVASESAKAQFLANMSHEIRSPMNGVLGMAEIIEREATTLARATEGALARDVASIAERARQIGASGGALIRVINDILDFSKIEAGRLDLHAAPFDLRATLEDASAIWATTAARKDLGFSLDLAPEGPSVVAGDADRLRQVLENIVGNAIKFTGEGHVRVSATVRPRGSDHVIEIAIADTGPGVPPDQRERIFGRFDMIDASYTRKAGGAGLGLAIARQLVEMMGGTVWVEEAEGGGARFRIDLTLPAAALPGDDAMTARRLERTVRRVLIVDDIPVNRLTLGAFHALYDVEIDEAENGAVAVRKAAETAYDVIYMDIQMPEMDGYAASRAIRAGEAEAGRDPAYIVLTSAHAFEAAITEARDAGMDDAIAKPIRRGDIERLLGPAGPAAGAASPPDASPAPDPDETRLSGRG